MGKQRKYSRRGIAGSLLAALVGRLPLRAQSTDAGRASRNPAAGGLPRRVTARTYRADAAILFLGLAIHRRVGVGDGKASLEETGEGANRRRTLFFAAASDPKHARGLSRLGWMREEVLGPEANPSEIAYSGILTLSPEESLEKARKSPPDPASGRSLFSAVRGRSTAGRSRSAVAFFEYAAGASWHDRALMEEAHALFNAEVKWRETSWPRSPGEAPPTFLYQVAKLLSKRTGSASGRYVYSEQEYLLELERQKPAHGSEHLLPVRGKIRNLRTGHETPFRLWLEEGSDSIVPVRFEYQPRSFLRLTFEAVPE